MTLPPGRHDWYRSKRWNAKIEAAFQAKIARSRSSKPQYLLIQAGNLARDYSDVSLRLLNQYFETGDTFFVADAHCVMAEAYRALGRIDDAVASYKLALDWTAENGGIITTARFDYPRFVALNCIESEYDRALRVLTEEIELREHRSQIVRYIFNGANALIADDMGEREAAIEFAQRAVRAAMDRRSTSWKHPEFGLVQVTDDDFGRRIKRIAQPGYLRKMFQVFAKIR